jgi:predicted negative regulator of RcsB-dependent stress response
MSDEERVLGWLEENYKGLLIGLLLGLSLLYGYKYFLSSQNSYQLDLSRQYDVAINKYYSGDNKPIIEFSKNNIIQNPDNIYTMFASLYSAKAMYIKNNYKEAHTYLDHIISNSPDDDIIMLAKYRKATIFIDQNKYTEAHDILGNNPKNYQHAELKGDLHIIQKNYSEAIKFYNNVLTSNITPNERKNIIKKINFIK